MTMHALLACYEWQCFIIRSEATDLPQRLSTTKQQKNKAKASENNIASNLA